VNKEKWVHKAASATLERLENLDLKDPPERREKGVRRANKDSLVKWDHLVSEGWTELMARRAAEAWTA
jgi:hypothetical protein